MAGEDRETKDGIEMERLRIWGEKGGDERFGGKFLINLFLIK